MGNQLIKNYDIEKESKAVGGVGSLWKIYQAVKQDKSKQEVSIFMFDKKVLEKIKKIEKEDFLNFIRKEAQNLAKIRHPNVLSLIEPLMEDSKSMAFITERIDTTLQTLINNNNYLEMYQTELEFKMHVLELLDGINFLHNDVKTVHASISPENVYVLPNGKWKLGGMIFTTQLITENEAPTQSVDMVLRSTDSICRMHPSMHFSAPEIMNEFSRATFSSDIFSLGLLIVTVLKCYYDKSTSSPYLLGHLSTLHNYRDKISDLHSYIFQQKYLQNVVPALKSLINSLLNTNKDLRPNANEVSYSPWLTDPFIQTIKHLETLTEKDSNQQQLFLKGLAKIILKFETSMLKKRVLPALINVIKFDQVSPIILGILINVLEENKKMNILTKEEFQLVIWPGLKTLAGGREIPAQCLFLIVSNIKLLCDYIGNADLQNSIMPLVIRCYECGVAKLQELALRNTDYFVKKLEFLYLKTKLLPKILTLCTDANNEIRMAALVCLSKIFGLFDRTTINDHILVTLDKVRKVGTDQKMNMVMLTIYDGISKVIGIEIIANKILPQIIPYLADQGLSKSEFKSYMNTIQNLLKKIEEEKMKGLNSIPAEEEFDMNSVMKELEEADKKKSETNERDIFSGADRNTGAFPQGGGATEDFEFLSVFDSQPRHEPIVPVGFAPQQQQQPQQTHQPSQTQQFQQQLNQQYQQPQAQVFQQPQQQVFQQPQQKQQSPSPFANPTFNSQPQQQQTQVPLTKPGGVQSSTGIFQGQQQQQQHQQSSWQQQQPQQPTTQDSWGTQSSQKSPWGQQQSTPQETAQQNMFGQSAFGSSQAFQQPQQQQQPAQKSAGSEINFFDDLGQGSAQGCKPMQLKKPPTNPSLSTLGQSSGAAANNLANINFKAPPNPFKNQQPVQPPQQTAPNNSSDFFANMGASNQGSNNFGGNSLASGGFGTQKQNMGMGSNIQQTKGMPQGQQASFNQGPSKGNMMKLDYDPFEEIEKNPSAGSLGAAAGASGYHQQQPQQQGNFFNSPGMNQGAAQIYNQQQNFSNSQSFQSSPNPTSTGMGGFAGAGNMNQNPFSSGPMNSNNSMGGGWDLGDDLLATRPPASNQYMGQNQGSMSGVGQGKQQQQQASFGGMYGQQSQMGGTNLFPQGNQIPAVNQGPKGTPISGDFDFFQNAKPAQTNLKINKINSFQSNDLI